MPHLPPVFNPIALQSVVGGWVVGEGIPSCNRAQRESSRESPHVADLALEDQFVQHTHAVMRRPHVGLADVAPDSAAAARRAAAVQQQQQRFARLSWQHVSSASASGEHRRSSPTG